MLQNWLKPIPAALAELAEGLSDEYFGPRLLRFQTTFPDLKNVKIALIGLAEKEANEVRRQLYSTVFPFQKLVIADLGNARKHDPTFLIQLIYELISGRVLPILIGSSAEQIATQFLAYQNTKSLVSVAVVDEKARFSSKIVEKLTDSIPKSLVEPLDSLLAPRHPMLFHFSQIGGQSHLTPPSALDFFEKNNFDFFRLGRSRASLEETEPLIRDADLLAMHLASLKKNETPAVVPTDSSPSGFTSEEACQLARYAGMSDKLTSFGVFGWQAAADRDGQTAQLVAQLIWYFIEGFFNRKADFPASTDGLTEYIVDFKDHDWSLTFWKSSKTGRWWLQVPVEPTEKQQRHRLIACSLADYQSACREELPDRLLNAFKRFS